MAPEQMERPTEVDHRADIYSLGVVIYEMLTGEMPIGRFPPPSEKVQIDVRIDHVVLRTLEKEPARRYQRASQVKSELASAASGAAALSSAACGVAGSASYLPSPLAGEGPGVRGSARHKALLLPPGKLPPQPPSKTPPFLSAVCRSAWSWQSPSAWCSVSC